MYELFLQIHLCEIMHKTEIRDQTDSKYVAVKTLKQDASDILRYGGTQIL